MALRAAKPVPGWGELVARTQKAGGAGLGLAIAQTIVEAHGGTLEIQSHPGEGT